MVRERELYATRQQLHAIRGFMERVRRTTTLLSAARSLQEGWEILAKRMVEESPYEFVLVAPAQGSPICRGQPLTEPQLLEILSLSFEGGVRLIELPRASGPCWLMGGWIGADQEHRLARLIVGRTERTARFYAEPWSDDIEQMTYLLDTVGHVAAAVQLRVELEEERNHLVRDVDRATRQLRTALEEAETHREEAEAASRAKSAFLANMSHELRTPLNAIIGYSELVGGEIEDGVPPEELLPDLARIRSAGHSLLALISDILDLSRIEAGRIEIHLEPFDACGVVRGACDALSPLALAQENRLEVELPPGELRLVSDPIKLRQIVVNLVGNACKFTRNGRIRVQAAPRDGGIAVVVADTGIGMSEELMLRLFEPFHQGEGGRGDRPQGSGLGLAISRGLAERLGGSIRVSSALQAGSEFELWLPDLDAPVGSRSGSAPG